MILFRGKAVTCFPLTFSVSDNYDKNTGKGGNKTILVAFCFGD